jgi:hypothetical protein
MNEKLMTGVRKMSLYGGILAAITYSAMTLYSQPAYAQTCTLAFCESTAPNTCNQYCIAHNSSYLHDVCEPGGTTFTCICQTGGANLPC